MKNKLSYIKLIKIIPVYICMLFSFTAAAQECLTGIVGNSEIIKQKNKRYEKSTHTAAELPYIEDFSNYTGYPAQAKFNNFQGYVNNTFAVYPPSLGCVTLDALNEFGEVYPHATEWAFPADTLLSKEIRLDLVNGAPANPGDSIYFSFYYQPAGGSLSNPIMPWELLGNQPDEGDSLVLEFGYATGDSVFHSYEFCSFTLDENYEAGDSLLNPYLLPDTIYHIFQSQAVEGEIISLACDSVFVLEEIWNHVWSTDGVALADWLAENPLQYFKQVLIPITDPQYFRENFQFRFRNYASLEAVELEGWSGNVDQWNIDYIYINDDRHKNDFYPINGDVTFVHPANTFLKKYQAMPWSQFRASDVKANYHNYISNLSATVQNGSYQFNVKKNHETVIFTRPSSQENIHPYAEGGLLNMPAAVLEPPITFAEDIVYDDQDSALFTVTHIYEIHGAASNDFISSNDTTIFQQKFYNYYAYDDGTAEAGYMINSPANSPNTSLAVKFTLAQPDRLRAVRMWFNHVYDDQNLIPFTLMVWAANSDTLPGEVIYSQPATMPEFGMGYSDFALYYFDEPIDIEGTFFVGFVQNSNTQLNIGFDQNTDARENFVYKVYTQWEEPILKGSPMIRPVVGKAFDPSSVEENDWITTTKIYPNPASDYCVVEIDNNNMQDSQILLIDMYGKVIEQYQTQNHTILKLSHLPKGFYLITIKNNNKILGTHKLIKQ